MRQDQERKSAPAEVGVRFRGRAGGPEPEPRVVGEDGSTVGYKARWREEDENGVRRNAAKRFSARKARLARPCAWESSGRSADPPDTALKP